jgi:uncharacterized protein YjdB
MLWTKICCIFIGFMVVALASCQSPALAQSGTDPSGLTVNWKLGSGSARSILPSSYPAPATYSVSIYSTSGVPVASQTGLTSTNWTFSNVPVGTYTVTIDGLDTSSNILATGSGAVTTSSASTSANVTVPLSYIVTGGGSGGVALTFDYTSAGVSNPMAALTVIDPSGTRTIYTSGSGLVASGTTFTWTKTSATVGSYQLLITLTAGTNMATKSETLLVAQDITTTATLSFSSADFTMSYVPVSSLTMNQTLNSTSDVGQYSQLTATPNSGATNPLVTWTSSNPSAATVDSNGMVHLLLQGSVTITATSVDSPTVTATCVFNVPTVSVTITAPTTFRVGTSVQLLATVNNSTYMGVTWSSNSPSIAAISPTGVLTCLNPGTTAITATPFIGAPTPLNLTVGSAVLYFPGSPTPEVVYLSPTGTLVSATTMSLSGTFTGTSLTADPLGRYLWDYSYSSGIETIYPGLIGTGAPSSVTGETAFTASVTAASNVVSDHQGKYIFLVAPNGSVQVIPIITNGLATAPVSTFYATSFGLSGISGISMVMNPSDTVAYFLVNTSAGTNLAAASFSAGVFTALTPLVTLTQAPSPSFIVLDPSGRNLYLANTTNPSIYCYAISPASSSSSGLSSTFSTSTLSSSAPNAFAINPQGAFLYVAEGNLLYSYSLVAGALTPTGNSLTFSTPMTQIIVDPTGQYLFASDGSNTYPVILGPSGAMASNGSPVAYSGFAYEALP